MRGPRFLLVTLFSFAIVAAPTALAQGIGELPPGSGEAIGQAGGTGKTGESLEGARPSGIPDLTLKVPGGDMSRSVCTGREGACTSAAGLLFFGYLVILLVGRYAWVVEPNNAHLRAQAKKLRARLQTEAVAKEDNPANGAGVIDELIDAAVGGEPGAGIGARHPKQGFIPEKTPFLAWSVAFTGKQLAAWRLLHEAERLAVDYYADGVLRDQAHVALEKLRAIPGSYDMLSRELSAAICSGIAADQGADCDVASRPIKPLLKEAKAAIYRDEDVRFEALASFQNKAFWLIVASLSSVIGLAITFPGAPVLLMAGATGGLLARLRKVIDRRAGSFDYGMSWSVLFLTPLVGALTGWIGTAIFQILLAWELLGKQFSGVDVFSANLVTVVVALAFGLSATLFDKFVEKIEQSLVNTEERRNSLPADETPPPTLQVQQKGAHVNKARRKRRPDADAKKTGARVATQTQPNS